MSSRIGRRVAVTGLALGAVALLLLLLAGPGTRFGLWEFRFGFALLRVAAWGGIGAATASIVGIALAGRERRALAVSVAGLLLGLAAFGVPWSLKRAAAARPPIHDVTTDTSDPPAFQAILALRADAPNPAAHGGPEVARAQAQAYPDIAPLVLDAPRREAFGRALRAARDMGWVIVAAEPSEGRIEATATTRWFGFRDDVVVRVRAEGGGSRVDVRSVSRVGRGDAGANAARVRSYLAKLREG